MKGLKYLMLSFLAMMACLLTSGSCDPTPNPDDNRQEFTMKTEIRDRGNLEAWQYEHLNKMLALYVKKTPKKGSEQYGLAFYEKNYLPVVKERLDEYFAQTEQFESYATLVISVEDEEGNVLKEEIYEGKGGGVK